MAEGAIRIGVTAVTVAIVAAARIAASDSIATDAGIDDTEDADVVAALGEAGAVEVEVEVEVAAAVVWGRHPDRYPISR
jgi:hypothetical protein